LANAGVLELIGGMKFALTILLLTLPAHALNLEGTWTNPASGQSIDFYAFDGLLTAHTTAHFASGEPEDYFYEFQLPPDLQPGEVAEGHMRSVDGYYGCLFDQPAELEVTDGGALKLHFPLLSFHLETRSVGTTIGYEHKRRVDWDGWRWVVTVFHFPIERWREVSSRCVIDQSNSSTLFLVR